MISKTPAGFPPFEILRTTPDPSPSFDLTELYQATTEDISAVYRSSSFLQPNDPVGPTHQTAQKRWSNLSDQPISDASLLSRVAGIETMPRRDFVASPAFNLDGSEPFGVQSSPVGPSVYGFYDGLPKDEPAAQPGWNPLKFDAPLPPPQPSTTTFPTPSSSSQTPEPISSFGVFHNPPSLSNLTLHELLALNGFHDDGRFSLSPSFGDTAASQAINELSVEQLEEFVFSLEGGMDWATASESVEGGEAGGGGGRTTVEQGGGDQSCGGMELVETVEQGILIQPAYDASFEE